MWITDWFRRKAKTATSPETGIHFVAQLNVRIMPMDRGTVFEDPLDEFLRQHRLGEVTGGGTKMAPEPDGISHCDAEIRLEKANDTVASQVIEFLENLGAPKGSVFRQASGAEARPFGLAEGLGLFLNGIDLPQEVYASTDINDVIDGCAKALGGQGALLGSWQGSRETALFFYGPSFQEMQAALIGYVATAPLCEKSRFVQIA
ncbi:MAG: hypothetical protein ACEQSU_07660 [Microgenomates group bacterium]